MMIQIFIRIIFRIQQFNIAFQFIITFHWWLTYSATTVENSLTLNILPLFLFYPSTELNEKKTLKYDNVLNNYHRNHCGPRTGVNFFCVGFCVTWTVYIYLDANNIAKLKKHNLSNSNGVGQIRAKVIGVYIVWNIFRFCLNRILLEGF